ncbi:MAG: PKD domain-containing protein [Flavobacteriales bacterium]|nr:PKD domain-containing protein [Flavobacteriales bacterium]
MSVDFSAWNIADTEFEYFWDFGDGYGDPDGNTETEHIYETPGTYCPNLIMTDQDGCQVFIQCEQTIFVDEFSIETSEVEPICFGESVIFTVDGATSYAWADETFITQIDETTFELEPSQTESFEIFGFYADCEASEAFDLIVNQLPDVQLDMPPGVCFGEDEFDLSGGTPNDISGTYYVDGTEATQFDPSQAAGQVYDIEYVYTDANGCVNNASTTFAINELPTVTLTTFDPLCANDMVINLEGGTPVDGIFFVEGTETADFDPSLGEGNYSAYYEYTDPNGCVGSDEQTIVVNPVPEPSFDLNDACLYDGLAVTNTSTISTGSIASVDWDFDGLSSSTDFNPDPVAITAGGDYTVTLIATSDQGCTNSIAEDVTVFAVPAADFSFDIGCEGDLFTITDASTIETGSISSWAWSIPQVGNFNGTIVTTPFEDYGNYPVELTVVSDEGCEHVITQQLEVYPNPDVAFELFGVCQGVPTEFTNMTNIPYSDITQYEWNFGNGDTATDLDPSTLYNAPGEYEVTLTATSEYGCVDSNDASILIYNQPEPAFFVSDSAFCAGEEVTFTDMSTVDEPSNLSQWMWVVNDQTVGFNSEFSYTFEEPGMYDVTLQVTSNYGCFNEVEVSDLVEAWPYPISDFEAGPLDSDLLGMTLEFIDASEGAVDWSYTFGDGTGDSGSHVTHTYETFGTYEVWQIAANEYGCTHSSSQLVEVNPEMLIYVPNAFTPDFDGVNDFFAPEISGFNIQDYSFQIFNRWGELLFETNDLSQGWIGDVQGGGYYAPEGVYVWRLVVQNAYSFEIQELDGYVTLIR